MKHFLSLLVAATLAWDVAAAESSQADVVDLSKILRVDLLRRMDVVNSGARRDDPVLLAQRRGELARIKDPQGRASLLAFMIEQQRTNKLYKAAYIDSSPEELERFLVARAEGELAWLQKSVECLMNPVCNWEEQPESRRRGPIEYQAELRRLLGDDKYARYETYKDSEGERVFVEEMQRRLPAKDRLSEAQVVRFGLALADEHQQLLADARRQRLAVRGSGFDHVVGTYIWRTYDSWGTDLLRYNVVPLYGVAKAGAPDEFAKINESAVEYASRLFDRASALLSRSQLAYFRKTLDRSLDEYPVLRRECEIYCRGTYGPDYEAARYRLDRLREPANYKAAATKLADQFRDEWHERALLAGVPARTFDRLVEALAKAELQYQEEMLECGADSACQRIFLPESYSRDALYKQAASVVGVDKSAAMQAYEYADTECSYVAQLRSELPSKHALTDREAGKLVMALAAERQRIVQRVQQTGLDIDRSLEFLSTWRSGSTGADQAVQRMASAADNARRLHDVAARLLDSEQLRHFDAIHRRVADEWERWLREDAETQKWVRLAATAQQP